MAPGDIKRLFARRLPHWAPDDLYSICLNEALGYLAVEVTFLGEPVQGLSVQLYFIDAEFVSPESGASLPTYDQVVAKLTTDAKGRVKHETLVPIGLYACRVEGQEDTLVTTVEDGAKPFVITLPIGRPYFDLVTGR